MFNHYISHSFINKTKLLQPASTSTGFNFSLLHSITKRIRFIQNQPF
ncbi:hypothetical protein SA930_0735 [Staphylococcus aureus 930918-3]|uniref:Uncharacterized protein n=1 Tax=Staphylococcus aureus (strain COL) TaxID=93062 RepID=A0A0H2X168_STAAC|nr:hypothetical protein SACOL0210 [Staphylococcus aureus subsp. aureus COL]EEW46076.1 hypothetical protein SA930_0735 [Staphylococcus aureus 930918-3]EEW48216.1 hypothetical protein SAD30_1771 [Staphylococcus aureus D30]EFU28671.1 hypothetical protein CGSSa01_13720 [Staphylococcus aureus subsp. aureus CGS01]KAJ47993.1 hypothetical protein HMPREF1625_00775 [Staphylococcus aureus 880]